MDTRTSPWRWWKPLLVGLAMTFSMGSSCLDPCQQLADKICSCENTAAERTACTRQVSIVAPNHVPDNNEKVACQQYLLRCECRELKAGNLEVCGLSRE